MSHNAYEKLLPRLKVGADSLHGGNIRIDEGKVLRSEGSSWSDAEFVMLGGE